jgi:hypothetical protein
MQNTGGRVWRLGGHPQHPGFLINSKQDVIPDEPVGKFQQVDQALVNSPPSPDPEVGGFVFREDSQRRQTVIVSLPWAWLRQQDECSYDSGTSVRSDYRTFTDMYHALPSGMYR